LFIFRFTGKTHSSNLMNVFRNTISGMQQKQAKADG